jgi:DtxR family Mn-dependent transcriptional regulator
MLSHSMENYVKAIYELQQQAAWVSTSALAERLEHAPASVTNMIKKLSEPSLSLVEYVPYQGARLTTVGEKVALEVIRHHRLIELYLAEVMGMPWDQVHAEAEKIEHVISEDLEDRMAEALGHPTVDPHGSPIPAKSGEIIERQLCRLVDVEVGQSGVVAEVYDENPELLRYLGKLGLYPNTSIKVVDREPFGGPLKVQIENQGSLLQVSEEVSRHILITNLQ